MTSRFIPYDTLSLIPLPLTQTMNSHSSIDSRYLTVTLDLYIMRTFFHLFRFAPFIGKECEGMVYVVDEWAGKFVDELDYLRELENTERFRNLMIQAGDAVIVPQPYPKLSSELMTVTQWVDGTKLSKIDKTTPQGIQTVKKLTKVLLNSYLIQMLETGFLHADPHPGNFLVTNEGTLHPPLDF